MKKYVLGFIFDSTMENVLLMHKNRPEWQNGLINGLGGKLNEGESPLACVVREIKEESGLNTQEDKWIKSGIVHSESFTMDVFGYLYEGEMDDANTLEDEPIEWFKIRDLPENTIENIPWLLHITLDKLKNNNLESFEVKYKK